MNSPSGAGNGHGMHRQPHERPGYNSRRSSTVSVDTRGQAAPPKAPPTPRAPSTDLNALPRSPRGAHAVFPGSNAASAAAQGSQAGAEASAASKLRYALIVFRLLQLGACAFNGWSAGSDAKMLADLAKYRGIYLPGVVLYLIIILCANAFTAVLSLAWLLLTARPAWRQRCSWCLGLTIPHYTADFVWDFILGCCWLVALMALVIQHRYLPIPLAATSLLTALFWASGGVAFALRVRMTQQGASSGQDAAEAAVQVQVSRQRSHAEPSKGAFAALVALSSPRGSSPALHGPGNEGSRSPHGRSPGACYRVPPQLHT